MTWLFGQCPNRLRINFNGASLKGPFFDPFPHYIKIVTLLRALYLVNIWLPLIDWETVPIQPIRSSVFGQDLRAVVLKKLNLAQGKDQLF